MSNPASPSASASGSPRETVAKSASPETLSVAFSALGQCPTGAVNRTDCYWYHRGLCSCEEGTDRAENEKLTP